MTVKELARLRVDVVCFILDCAFGGFPLHLPFRLTPLKELARLRFKPLSFFRPIALCHQNHPHFSCLGSSFMCVYRALLCSSLSV